eukprot:ANDGO_02891.mRNA.1 Dynein-1-beta heavy chain
MDSSSSSSYVPSRGKPAKLKGSSIRPPSATANRNSHLDMFMGSSYSRPGTAMSTLSTSSSMLRIPPSYSGFVTGQDSVRFPDRPPSVASSRGGLPSRPGSSASAFGPGHGRVSPIPSSRVPAELSSSHSQLNVHQQSFLDHRLDDFSNVEMSEYDTSHGLLQSMFNDSSSGGDFVPGKYRSKNRIVSTLEVSESDVLQGPNVGNTSAHEAPPLPSASVFNYGSAPTSKKTAPTSGNSREVGRHLSKSSRLPNEVEPKVKVRIVDGIDGVHRKLEIERRRRAFLQEDIGMMLAQSGITIHDMNCNVLPLTLLIDDRNLCAAVSLDSFDSSDFDEREPAEWFENLTSSETPSHEGGAAGVPAKALHPTTVLENKFMFWEMCRVHSWDRVHRLFRVAFDRDNMNCLTNAANFHLVPRLNVLFIGEDPSLFCDRVLFAVAARKECAKEVLKHFVLKQMPVDALPGVAASSLDRIIRLTKSPSILKKTPTADSMVHEVTEQFLEVQNQIIQSSFFSDASKFWNGRFYCFGVPYEVDVSFDSLVSTRADLPIECPAYEFEERLGQFRFHTFLQHPPVLTSLSMLRAECLRVQGSSKMFQFQRSRPFSLEEYEQIQTTSINSLGTTLREHWVPNIASNIENLLSKVQKGWMHLGENSREVYEMGKLARFFKTVRLIMSDTLRFIGLLSLADFEKYIVEQAEQTSSFGFPLFALELAVVDQRVDFQRDHPSRAFSVLTSIVEKAVRGLNSIPKVEALVIRQFFWGKSVNMELMDEREECVVEVLQRLKKVCDRFVAEADLSVKHFQRFESVIKLDAKKWLSDNISAGPDFPRRLSSALRYWSQMLVSVDTEIPIVTDVGFFRIGCRQVQTRLRRLCQDMYKAVAEAGIAYGDARSSGVISFFGSLTSRLQKTPTQIEDVVNIRELINMLDNEVHSQTADLEDIRSTYDVLERFAVPLDSDIFERRWLAVAWPNRIQTIAKRQMLVLASEETRFHDLLLDQVELYQKRVAVVSKDVLSFMSESNLNEVDRLSARAQNLRLVLQEVENESRVINQRQKVYKDPTTDFGVVKNLQRDFEPVATFWQTAFEWKRTKQAVYFDKFESIDADAIERSIQSTSKAFVKIAKLLPRDSVLYASVEETKNEVDEFKPILPVLSSLRQPGMKARHWSKLSEKIGKNLVPGETFSNFSELLAIGSDDLKSAVDAVSDSASKEFTIEMSLTKMQDAWAKVVFDLTDYKSTNTSIVRGWDEIISMVDDHAIMTQSMLFSPYREVFNDIIQDWNSKLQMMGDVLEEWILCQRQWLYLEPIFSSADIQVQLPLEFSKFANVDKFWRKTMRSLRTDSFVLPFCTRSRRLLKQFVESNKVLDEVQKGLDAYLETKRRAFARFYFLSNDELLEILSQTKDPLAVQPHLRKCFENIHRLQFSGSSITHMVSGEGEVVPLSEIFAPSGNVEDWLKRTEGIMKESVRKLVEIAVQAYASVDRNDWVLSYPGQVILVGAQVYWTREVEEAIVDGTLPRAAKRCEHHLLALTELVQKNLTLLNRITLSALITMDVHNRDVTERLRDMKVGETSAFDWVSQLRYYWDSDRKTCIVKQVDAHFEYGYEYLGNTSRLVVTPLTDRIYLTLTGALHLNLGGAPAGPAGTGKTETTKDLAKALAKQCVVFNCQEGLDHLAMGKFFKGLAMAGAWACFDEFNRIDVEVLSVVAQQMTTLQQALVLHSKNCIFEGTEIYVDPTFAIFITMNPGYAGRTELPDNLKALFRPVACMVPDYALIAEIRLFSFGFKKAKILAQKMVLAFRLSSEQLSSQDHYDFGMRAVNTVILAAGMMKRKHNDQDEDQLLIRAVRDSNIPKFLPDDIQQFEGIISDLFIGIDVPSGGLNALTKELDASCRASGLIPTPSFVSKCVQLYETAILRHGVMLVGGAGGGKTSSQLMLQRALGELAAVDALNYAKTHRLVCNPKSITMGQLYGEFDKNSHEWTDGVLAHLFRQAARDESSDHFWVVFDGPVDALWIETMNTVLDDNKKLCLVSGEIIPMTPRMNILFEVEDLAVASPATVSRCGMVYMDPSSTVQWDAMLESWICGLPQLLVKFSDTVRTICRAIVPNITVLIRKECSEYCRSTDNGLLNSFFKVASSIFCHYVSTPVYQPPEFMLQNLEEVIAPALLFSFTWTFGAAVDGRSRQAVDKFFRKHIKSGLFGSFPEGCSVYDMVFVHSSISALFKYFSPHTPGQHNSLNAERDAFFRRWVPWLEYLHAEGESVAYSPESLVPTTDSLRSTYLLRLLASQMKHVICCGPTGTGKSLVINNLLYGAGQLPSFVQTYAFSFSARTSANQLQDFLDSKLDKRRKGTYGPPAGQQGIVFIDDFNMPAPEMYGAQPSLELIRQWLDHGGWYDRHKLEFKSVQDLVFIAAMAPPGGGRHPLSSRLIRHFNVLSFPDLSESEMSRVFSTILNSYFVVDKGFFKDVRFVVAHMVKVMCGLFQKVTADLRPTPTKSHYLFSLRDLSAVITGVVRASPLAVSNASELLLLFRHELQRVFRDRLVDEQDGLWFDAAVKDLLSATDDKAILTSLRSVDHDHNDVFQDFLNTESLVGTYHKVQHRSMVDLYLRNALDDYNAQTGKPMHIVLFGQAVEHVCRIIRVLRQSGGNCLLLGIGGSGRQSLVRLAAFICDHVLIELSSSSDVSLLEWRNDLKKAMKVSGLRNDPSVIMAADAALNDLLLEDLNSLLSNGDISGLFDAANPNDAADLEHIFKEMQSVCVEEGLPITRPSMWARFIKRVRRNLHIVVAMSPIGEVFRRRGRMFPSLISCCTIDYFSAWSADALLSVGDSQIRQSISHFSSYEAVRTDVDSGVPNRKLNFSESAVQSFIRSCVAVHQIAENTSRDYFMQMKRPVFVTPASYLELLRIFMETLFHTWNTINSATRRLSVGLEKLREAESIVAGLQQDLEALKPKLQKAQEQIERMMVQISADREQADQTREQVIDEEKEASQKAKECQMIKDEAQRDLDKALPALDAALSSLQSLKVSDLQEVGSYKTPPSGVKLVLEAVCIMLEVAPRKVVASFNTKVDDYWEPAKGLLRDARGFLETLFTFNRDSIDEKRIHKILPYYNDPEFDPARIEKVSRAARSMCLWVRAMVDYYRVSVEVAPKRLRLRDAEDELAERTSALKAAKQRLEDVETRIAELEIAYEEALANKDELQAKVVDCATKLDRAGRLTSGLSGEKIRWGVTLTSLEEQSSNIHGDALLAAAGVAYSGPLSTEYRFGLYRDWMKVLRDVGLPYTTHKSVDISESSESLPVSVIRSMLSDPVEEQKWFLCGLPSDTLSVENALMSLSSLSGDRWPLFIDPQGQANTFVRNLYRADNPNSIFQKTPLDVVRGVGDEHVSRVLENAVRFGRALLVENLEDVLPSFLEPVFHLSKSSLIRLSGTGSSGIPGRARNLTVRIAEQDVPVNASFRLYMTTKLRNPHYTPETSSKVMLINFAITKAGLEEQLLGVAVQKERPDLEELKRSLVQRNASMQSQLKGIEDNILRLLSESKGDVLEDEVLINTLSTAKVTSEEINAKVKEAKITEAQIDVTREQYRFASRLAAHVFFCLQDLGNIDPMYQFSLQWFLRQFMRAFDQLGAAAFLSYTSLEGDVESIEAAPPSAPDEVRPRLKSLRSLFLHGLYHTVCRSLFERHKLMFSFALSVTVDKLAGFVSDTDWECLLRGPTAVTKAGTDKVPRTVSRPEVLSDSVWKELTLLLFGESAISSRFSRLRSSLLEPAVFAKVYNSEVPLSTLFLIDSTLHPLSAVTLLRSVRQDKVLDGIRYYVSRRLGNRFVEPPPFNLAESYRESSPCTPLIFLLSAGADPMKELLHFADEMNMGRKLVSVSLGKGQGPIAEKLIEDGKENGNWVLLQNCHLASSWMPSLEKIVEGLISSSADASSNNCHRQFRLWLTSMPTPEFPQSVLQDGVKMTNEPPRGIRASLQRTFASFISADVLRSAVEDRKYQKAIYSLAFFHAVVLERRKFGPLGFNVFYEFTSGDFAVCLQQLRLFYESSGDIPLKVVRFLFGEINYGGRVTDDWDRRCLMTSFDGIVNERSLESDDFEFGSVLPGMDSPFSSLPSGSMNEYRMRIDDLPSHAAPFVFGLHSNAEITHAGAEGRLLLSTMLAMQPRQSSSNTNANALSREDIVRAMAEDMLMRLPKVFAIEEVAAKYPMKYEDSMNNVLIQECMRYNKLLKEMHSSLPDLIKATRGLVVMSEKLDRMADSMFTNVVPVSWTSKSYPSVKPLSSWFADLLDRLQFLNSWYETAPPASFWISGIYFPQAFLTAVLQNFARKFAVPIDTVSFAVKLSSELGMPRSTPEEGVFIHGLYMEGARWNVDTGSIDEARPLELFNRVPVMHLIPQQFRRLPDPASVYMCPVYKTTERRGTLSTTGHSTNFITSMELPTGKQFPSHWILRGVACVCATPE